MCIRDRAKAKPKFRDMLSKSRAINILSAARLFLFGARDVWFVVALPVYLSSVLGWDFWLVEMCIRDSWKALFQVDPPRPYAALIFLLRL